MSHATDLFKLRREITRLEHELRCTNSELRVTNAELTLKTIQLEDARNDLDTVDERFDRFEARLKEQLKSQLLKQRKEISDLKAAMRFECFDEYPNETVAVEEIAKRVDTAAFMVRAGEQ